MAPFHSVRPNQPRDLSVRTLGTSSLEIFFALPTALDHFPVGVVPHIRYRSQFALRDYEEALAAASDIAALNELQAGKTPSLESFLEDDPRQGWIDVDVGEVLLKADEGFKPNLTRVISDLQANTEYMFEVRLRSKDVSLFPHGLFFG